MERSEFGNLISRSPDLTDPFSRILPVYIDALCTGSVQVCIDALNTGPVQVCIDAFSTGSVHDCMDAFSTGPLHVCSFNHWCVEALLCYAILPIQRRGRL